MIWVLEAVDGTSLARRCHQALCRRFVSATKAYLATMKLNATVVGLCLHTHYIQVAVSFMENSIQQYCIVSSVYVSDRSASSSPS